MVFNVFLIVRELSSMHSKRLKVNFKSSEELEDREISIKTDEITDLFRKAESVVKKFKILSSEEVANAADLKVRDNVQRTFARKLQLLSNAFRTNQKVIFCLQRHIILV
jgi:hypothetical protein